MSQRKRSLSSVGQASKEATHKAHMKAWGAACLRLAAVACPESRVCRQIRISVCSQAEVDATTATAGSSKRAGRKAFGATCFQIRCHDI